MTINPKILMAKARGFTISIEKMNDTDRKRSPSAQYGKDYNNLLQATEEMFPKLVNILPPKIEIGKYQTGNEFTIQQYSEIDSYCEQIYQLVSECNEH